MSKTPKPRVLGDVYFPSAGARARNARPNISRRIDNFSPLRRRINLSLGYGSVADWPLQRLAKGILLFSAVSFLVFGSVFAPTIQRAAGQSSEDERKALEEQLKGLEAEIAQYEGQIVGYQKQGKTLNGEISGLNGKIAKLNLQIQAINLTIRDLDRKIGDAQKKISITEETIDKRKVSLGRLLQGLYEAERASLVEVFLSSPKLSDFFGNLQGLVLLQSDLRVEIGRVIDLRDELRDQKEQFSLARADAETAKDYRAVQKQEIDVTKQEKNRLLQITKGEESKYQTLLEESKKNAAEIRKRIFKLLGGGELSFEEAYNFAKLASGATGVRPALILAVLDRESALGQNVGRCNYKEAMHPTRDLPIFLELVKALNINPDSITVSCPIRSDGAYGGAMGPAQFIPSTWQIYSEKVSKITGNSPASPWNNGDAFMATALYVNDMLKSASCVEYSRQIPDQSQILLERCAAAKYYAGSRWYSYRWTYGEAVLSHARRFEEDIATITS